MPSFVRAGRVPLALLCIAVSLWMLGASRAQESPTAVVMGIDGPIGPAVSDHVRRGLRQADEIGAAIVVLEMDTPGGLDSSMREIIQDILSSPVPVAVFVSPSGAHAASAGTYILYASHVAAMAPGTSVGAATPVQIGGGFPSRPSPADNESEQSGEDGPATEDPDAAAEPDDEEAPTGPYPTVADKAVSDATAYLRSLAQMRGRNADWAEKAVLEAATLSAEEALAAGVIDLMADNVDDLLRKIDGRTVTVDGEDRQLTTASLTVTKIEPDWRTKLLAVITDPNIAYLLLLGGIYGLILEFYTGTVFAGVFGAISLVLGLYALHVLPINYAGAALIGIGTVLLIAEAIAPSFGVLGFGGIVAFVVGSVLLIRTDVPGFGISWMVIGSVALVGSALILLTAILFMRSRRRAVVTGVEEMIGGSGNVVEWSGESGRVRIRGEIWRARGAGALGVGSKIRVTAIDGLTLVVEPEANGG